MAAIISLEDVSFQSGEKQILTGINFSVTAGEKVSISGPSGSGKSTILKLISSLISPTAGKIKFKNQDIAELPFVAYRQKVSYCFQIPSLFGDTIRENVEFPAQIRGEKPDLELINQYLAEVRLDYLDLDKRINSLSGGEKQRVALIRHLIYPPEVLLLDEVTASVDNETSEIIWRWLFKQAAEKQMTLIWVSHKQAEIEAANHQIAVDEGKIAGERQVKH